MKHAVIAVAAAALLAGCVSTNAVRIGVTPSRPEVPTDRVLFYRTAEQVPGKYEEIALLNSEGSAGFTSESGMVNSMKKKAGQLGANAVILDAVSEPGAGARVAGAFLGVGVPRKGKAIAIYVFPADEKK